MTFIHGVFQSANYYGLSLVGGWIGRVEINEMHGWRWNFFKSLFGLVNSLFSFKVSLQILTLKSTLTLKHKLSWPEDLIYICCWRDACDSFMFRWIGKYLHNKEQQLQIWSYSTFSSKVWPGGSINTWPLWSTSRSDKTAACQRFPFQGNLCL